MNIIIQKEIGSFFLSLPPIPYFRYKNSVARSIAQNRAKNPFPVEAFALSANIKYEFVTDIAIHIIISGVGLGEEVWMTACIKIIAVFITVLIFRSLIMNSNLFCMRYRWIFGDFKTNRSPGNRD